MDLQAYSGTAEGQDDSTSRSSSGTDSLRRCGARSRLNVMLAGRVGVGKSTLVNAIFGAPIAPVSYGFLNHAEYSVLCPAEPPDLRV